MNTTIRIRDLATFCVAFGSIGLKGGPRTGPDKRTQEDEEWFVVRRFLLEGLRSEFFQSPLTIQKAHPPDPDFILHFDTGDTGLIEITEATHPDDQREMALFERSNESLMLVGQFGGRFADGASQPGRAWASDIIDAVARKAGKAICSRSEADRHLVIYPNSNASFLMFADEKDECAAFGFLNEGIDSKRADLIRGANGCVMHVLAAKHVCFDLLGQNRLVQRGT